MSLVGFRNWTIGPFILLLVTYAVLRSRRAPRGPRQLYGYGYSFSWSSSTGFSCITQTPLASSEVEGRWQWPSPCCHPLYGTACAVGLTWRPLSGSLFLSSLWCRLKPGPSGERGRKSSLLQDMLVTGRQTRTTGGRSSRGLTGNDPKTVGRRYHRESRVCSEIQGDPTVGRKPGHDSP